MKLPTRRRHRTSFGRPTSPISRLSTGGVFYLSTILDDYSRYITAWKLCTNMKADDVTATLTLALEASGCNRANVVHKPQLENYIFPADLEAQIEAFVDHYNYQ